ncbi:hypothetical protein M2139_001639 [Enterococcus sp. PF1-24]|uniref:hypothetical protein n=1 Tax=unclassified Enterococcus TaxID=2608891 RepID=UPI002475A2E4|nr:MULTISPECIES: hypothetical protein [unclassified Enterococcus]MDH6364652.1 hypothetical protein [Enterococcus sp. PFB1-1]MDH6401753.1 hypothetical protein [Enterococcus sp. PF1-24]
MVKKQETKKVANATNTYDVEKWRQRKLSVLAQKNGQKYNRAANLVANLNMSKKEETK